MKIVMSRKCLYVCKFPSLATSSRHFVGLKGCLAWHCRTNANTLFNHNAIEEKYTWQSRLEIKD